MSPDKMTLQECCDALAEFAGFTRHEPAGGGEYWWTHESSRDPIYGHPIHPTLDSIAGALPEGWMWDRIFRQNNGVWRAWCTPHHMVEGEEGFGDTELLARARAAVKAWIAAKGTA